MRWLFVLLLVLNVFYYGWHQQEAPLRAKDVTPLNLYRGSQQDIRLLSEADNGARSRSNDSLVEGQCLYLFVRKESVQALVRRLADQGVKVQTLQGDMEEAEYWLRISPESQRLLGEVQFQNLSKEFNELKHKIMLCEGVAPAE